MEQGFNGVCESKYSIHELSDIPVGVNPRLCQGDKYFQIIKIRDYANCEGEHNRDRMTSMSTTRYLGCGDSKETFKVLNITSDSEHQDGAAQSMNQKVFF